MGESLRNKLLDMFRGWDHIQLSQFTIDWIQEFEDEFAPDVQDRAIAYTIDTIREVLQYGIDKDFFDMLATYCRLWIK